MGGYVFDGEDEFIAGGEVFERELTGVAFFVAHRDDERDAELVRLLHLITNLLAGEIHRDRDVFAAEILRQSERVCDVLSFNDADHELGRRHVAR